jgi:hypothetical protein
VAATKGPLKQLKFCNTCRWKYEMSTGPHCVLCWRPTGPNYTRWEPASAGVPPPKLDPAGDIRPSAREAQVGGDHYAKQPIQPWEYCMANKLDPVQATAIKYITRFRDKGGKEDLEKAIHSIQWLIEWEYGDKKKA